MVVADEAGGAPRATTRDGRTSQWENPDPGLDEALALIVDRVDQHRARRGQGVERLAAESGLTRSSLSDLRHRRGDPRLSTLLKLCTGLGVSSTDLLGDLAPLPPARKRRRPVRVSQRGEGVPR